MGQSSCRIGARQNIEMSQELLSERPLSTGGKDPVKHMDRVSILEQVEKVLESPLFTQSKRYPLVLRYLVNHALEGSKDAHLKERTIGVEVLGRNPNYDTNEDPTVRVVVGEIRKRLVHYYLEPGHESEIQIELPLGSYIPEFTVKPLVNSAVPVKPRSLKKLYISVGVAMSAALLLLVGYNVFVFKTALDRFWDPVLHGSPSVLLCVGERLPYGSRPALEDRMTQQTFLTPEPPIKNGAANDMHQFISSRPGISIMTAIALTNVAEFLQPRGSRGLIQVASSTSLKDLRQGPAILIGSFNNYWTLHLVGNLHFRFKTSNEESLSWIEDGDHPSVRNWSMKLNVPYKDISADYGLITRVADPSSGHIIVSVGGVTPIGLVTASEFLVSPAGWEAVAKQAPKDWEHKNLQVVIGGKVINGNSGPPSVLATYFW